jgi:hypothetical protein
MTTTEPHARPRGRCPWCGRSYALTTAGRLRFHQARRTSASEACAGSGRYPLRPGTPWRRRSRIGPGMMRPGPAGGD